MFDLNSAPMAWADIRGFFLNTPIYWLFIAWFSTWVLGWIIWVSRTLEDKDGIARVHWAFLGFFAFFWGAYELTRLIAVLYQGSNDLWIIGWICQMTSWFFLWLWAWDNLFRRVRINILASLGWVLVSAVVVMGLGMQMGIGVIGLISAGFAMTALGLLAYARIEDVSAFWSLAGLAVLLGVLSLLGNWTFHALLKNSNPGSWFSVIDNPAVSVSKGILLVAMTLLVWVYLQRNHYLSYAQTFSRRSYYLGILFFPITFLAVVCSGALFTHAIHGGVQKEEVGMQYARVSMAADLMTMTSRDALVQTLTSPEIDPTDEETIRLRPVMQNLLTAIKENSDDISSVYLCQLLGERPIVVAHVDAYGRFRKGMGRDLDECLNKNISRINLKNHGFASRAMPQHVGGVYAPVIDPASGNTLGVLVFELSAPASPTAFAEARLFPLILVGLFGLMGVTWGHFDTRKRHAMWLLMASHSRYQTIFENSPATILLINKEQRIEQINRACFGGDCEKEPDGWVGRKMDEFYTGEDAERVALLIRRAFDGAPASSEVSHMNNRGEPITLQISFSPVLIGDEPVRQVVAIATDITERKRAENLLLKTQAELQMLNNSLEKQVQQRTSQLKVAYERFQEEVTERQKIEVSLTKSEAWMRLIIQHIKDYAIFMLSPDGQILSWNSGGEKILGYAEHEVIGQHICSFMQQEKDCEILSCNLQDGRKRGMRLERELLLKRKSGVVFDGKLVFSEVNAEDGELLGFACIIADISRQKQFEDNLVKALEKEKEMGRLRQNFISMVTHELRTPLTVINLAADIIKIKGKDMSFDDQRKHVDNISDSVHEMTSLLNQILQQGQLESGKLDLKPEPVEVVSTCNRIYQETREKRGADKRLHIECPNEELFIKADQRALDHILSNLLGNALKYSDGDKPVYLQIGHEGNEAVMHIRDQGIGIPAEDIPKLFEPFQRGNNVTNIKGTGLGLTIVKQCVDMLKGNIDVQSAPNKGTTFTVKFPLIR